MAGLPKALIKKYGVSKKAWSVFRNTTSKTRKTTMARKRFSRLKRYARRATNVSTPFGVILPAMVYGASRRYVSDALAPLTSKVPLGTYADEVVLGTIGYFMAKKGSGMVKSAGQAILTVEAASLGNQIAGGVMTSSSSQTVNNYYV